MDNYKKASQLQLRFTTTKGVLSLEQLWDLTQSQLTNLVRSIKAEIKSTSTDDDIAFLSDSVPTKEDTLNQLRFELVKDIYLTKKAEAEAKRNATEKKEFQQKILSIIQEKKEGSLKEKSIEELEALLK